MLKLGVPSKGRLMDQCFDWFGARGVTLSRKGSDREYAGAVDGADGVELNFGCPHGMAERGRTSCATSWPTGRDRSRSWRRWASAMPIW